MPIKMIPAVTLVMFVAVVLGSNIARCESSTRDPVRESAIREFYRFYNAGKISEARATIVKLIDGGHGLPEDATVLGRTYLSANLIEAERWFRVAVDKARGQEMNTSENVHLLLAGVLWRRDKKDEALLYLATAGNHPSFERSSRFDPRERLSEEWANGRELFVAYAEALEASDRSDAALPYRRVAAAGVTKAGFWAIRRGRNDQALSYFAEADQILPLEQFPTDVQMTVLRDMIVAYWRVGLFFHAATAVERLFGLCHPVSEGNWSCPAEGVASAPLRGGEGSFSVRIDGIAIHPLPKLHLALASKLAERVFVSVSWDPIALTLRSNVQRGEFLGGTVGSGNSRPPSDDPSANCVDQSGVSYAQATGWEEDRVEYERCWLSLNTDKTFRDIVRAQVKAKNYRLVVKGMLADLQFYLRFGAIAMIESVNSQTVAGIPIEEIEADLSTSDDEPTKAAFDVARRLVKLITEVQKWTITE